MRDIIRKTLHLQEDLMSEARMSDEERNKGVEDALAKHGYQRKAGATPQDDYFFHKYERPDGHKVRIRVGGMSGTPQTAHHTPPGGGKEKQFYFSQFPAKLDQIHSK